MNGTVRNASLLVLAATLLSSPRAHASGGCDPLPFGSFVYSQEPAFGFCPELGAVYRAQIALKDGACPAEFILEMSVLEEGTRGVDPCLDLHSVVDCVKETVLPPRVLTDVEVSDLFSTSTAAWGLIRDEPDPNCEAIDPCVVQVFDWGGIRASDGPCDTARLPLEGVEILTDLLERLRRGPLAAENGDTNGDGARDLSDAVYLLDWLFRGGPRPVGTRSSLCPDCPPEHLVTVQNGDSNGDGARDLSDAVYLLSWLFLAGSEPVPACSCSRP